MSRVTKINFKEGEEVPYSKDINVFAEQVVWYAPSHHILEKKNSFLLHMMRDPSTYMYEHAKKYFNYTDDDFRNALKHASPGIIMYKEIWELWNERLEIIPPLPFPKKKFFSQMTEEELEEFFENQNM